MIDMFQLAVFRNKMMCMVPLWLIALSLLGIANIRAQAILAPPFGMQWGDKPDKVLDWAQAKKLDAVIKIPGAHPELREIRVSAVSGPLPGTKAYALEARYHWGALFEVTVHYGAPGMKPKAVKSDFMKLQLLLAAKHGTFVANHKQDKREDGLLRRSLSYHVEPVAGLLLLMAYSEVEDTLRSKESARYSLLYRNENIIPKE
ncbi:hypothetical protein JO972_05810 [Verrucomicrobiaceae bacterium 5K15]|uniref:Uncharacterized protein n=1 Tax=Oceaniferula flava TaxID=2800421 RepID=A0AAE2S9X6_9BACT|nr:hypothetical protein [Oceaniferula flavus]MBK1854463.1 hypothetical protein [Oceaniferula flavus]MBM1135769.1 hypothetical protein [Oceaniferula flavus]